MQIQHLIDPEPVLRISVATEPDIPRALFSIIEDVGHNMDLRVVHEITGSQAQSESTLTSATQLILTEKIAATERAAPFPVEAPCAPIGNAMSPDAMHLWHKAFASLRQRDKKAPLRSTPVCPGGNVAFTV